MNRTILLTAITLAALGLTAVPTTAEADGAYVSIVKAQAGLAGVGDRVARAKAAHLVSKARSALNDQERAGAKILAEEALAVIRGTHTASVASR